ncbi:hypothetical protein [Leptospira ilyithenensis]|uniref:Redoxin n=1 Tax=Leptospira ilyithenensis TaxID=2484901 RepID=A0A4R9LN76_9LEPT|nr:hypothetical protein [Leptospira ilyithenensis]TGN10095.1 hypothetical protein EHS11_11080 [Leptospira ilyithenensis]
MKVFLGDKPIELLGKQPKQGEWIKKNFRLPAAYNTKIPFTPDQLKAGLVIVSTLPKIKSNECSAQILNLEQELAIRKINAKIVHIACDCADHWEEVKNLHPFLKAKGFSLKFADTTDINSFKEFFGVGVKGSPRIAHGLFAFQNGYLIQSMIPRQQYGIPNIKKLLDSISS